MRPGTQGVRLGDRVPVRTQDATCQEVRALTLQAFSRALLNFTPFGPGTLLPFLKIDVRPGRRFERDTQKRRAASREKKLQALEAKKHAA